MPELHLEKQNRILEHIIYQHVLIAEHGCDVVYFLEHSLMLEHRVLHMHTTLDPNFLEHKSMP
jgi:hypothetical protein